ncbi:META domain-containing protein [Tenacibaculum jejuense]|uniref:Lipocalin-like domain-containing protein n=1 Tax=Tenacibaculum jejuense TaxID=584609 RepID=A0A238U8R0_9FLAO|nr:hypothetical protein [Tenacibaculum jejuense]SNR14968.1 conserved exported protein of unknown function [Tenacibaculum jejuense]
MKKQIRTIVSITFLTLLIGLTSCSKDEDNNIQPNTIEGSWKVTHYIQDGNKITKAEKPTWPDINDGEITLLLAAENEEGERSASGKTVTNNFFGEYNIDTDKKISFSVFTTFISEPEWTQLFALNKVNRYDIINNNLILYYEDVSIVLEKQ